MFDLETRKKYTKDIVETVSKTMLSFINNQKVCGWLMVILHTIFGLYLMFFLITQEINNMYHIYTFMWVIVIYLNYYFNGCILSRIEKNIFQDKMWGGPISVLLYMFYDTPPDKSSLNNFIKYVFATPLSIIIILKYIYYENPISIFIMILLIPLSLIHSQCNIFNYTM